MPRKMSFMLTTEQIKNQTKTVTRRLGWDYLRAGDIIDACEKCMGLKKGEKVKVLTQIFILSTHPEPLHQITQEDVIREGFPDMTPVDFISMFCQSHKGCTPETTVNVINFDYWKASASTLQTACS